MKILITGGSGFIGRNLAESYSLTNTVLIHTKKDDLALLLSKFTPDLIFHCAAEIYQEPAMLNSNIILTYTLIDYLRKHPETKMIHFGSSTEYGPVKGKTAETDPANPVNSYQATKAASTMLCQGYAREYNLDIKIARIYSAYGKHEKPFRLMPTLYRGFIKGEPLNIYKGTHDFIYIKDLVRGIQLLADSPVKPGEIVNFGSGTQHTNLEVLRMWKNVAKTDPSIIYHDVPRSPDKYEAEDWVADTSYAYDTLGFSPEYNLQDGIRDFISTQR